MGSMGTWPSFGNIGQGREHRGSAIGVSATQAGRRPPHSRVLPEESSPAGPPCAPVYAGLPPEAVGDDVTILVATVILGLPPRANQVAIPRCAAASMIDRRRCLQDPAPTRPSSKPNVSRPGSGDGFGGNAGDDQEEVRRPQRTSHEPRPLGWTTRTPVWSLSGQIAHARGRRLNPPARPTTRLRGTIPIGPLSPLRRRKPCAELLRRHLLADFGTCRQLRRRYQRYFSWKRNVRPSFRVLLIWPKFGAERVLPGSAN